MNQEFTRNLTMNFWPNLLVQQRELRPKIHGSVPGSGFGSWFDKKMDFLGRFWFLL
jgi:hypothetical protein